MKFRIHKTNTTSLPVVDQLQSVQESLGFVPNLFGVIAESPPALQAFLAMNQQFGESSLTALEREVVQIAASVENDCAYCIAGHTAFADLLDLDSCPINEARDSRPLTDPKLQALQAFTRAVVQQRGHLNFSDLADFEAAGYGSQAVIDVVLGVCVKFFSNLTNNIVGIPLDREFEPFAWTSGIANNQTQLTETV